MSNEFIVKRGLIVDGNSTIRGMLAVDDNLVVGGDFIVDGTSFIVNVGIVEAEDNIIKVNNGEVGAGVTAGTSGIQVDRGTSDDYFFMFRESDDAFVIGLNASLQTVATREDSPNSNSIAYWNSSSNRFDTNSNIVINSNGNVGIGNSALESWSSGYSVMQIGGNASFYGTKAAGGSNFAAFSQNSYYDDDYYYQDTGGASIYGQSAGTHSWRVATSGTADTSITWNYAMDIDSAGNVGINNTTPSYKLDVNGDVNTTGSYRVNGTPIGYWAVSGSDVYYNSGKVGIGTDSPSYNLSIATSASDTDLSIENYSTTGHYPSLRFEHSNHATIGTKSETQDGDNLGSIFFSGVDAGNGSQICAIVTVKQDGAAGTEVPSNMILRTYSSSGQNTNQLVLHNSGNVGIGTIAPTAYNSDADRLVVYGTGPVGITIVGGSGDSSNIYFADGTGAGNNRGQIRYNHNADTMTFATVASSALRIGDDGNTDVLKQLTVTGTTKTQAHFYAGSTDPTNTDRLNYDGNFYATNVYNPVFADIADYQELADELVFGKCYYDTIEGAKICNKKCQLSVIGIASDTLGYGLGYKEGDVPIAVAGWVLAYVDKEYPCGTPLTNNENGDLTEIPLEMKRDFPERIVGIYKKKESKKEWGTINRKIKVNDRHWIKVK